MALITLIHGDDTAASRRILSEQKALHPDTEIITLTGVGLALPQLVLACETKSLLSEKKLIIIENLFKGGVKLKAPLIQYITLGGCGYPVIVWEDRKLETVTLKKNFPKAQVIAGNFPPILFSFLYSLGSLPPSELLARFHACLREKEATLVHAMIVRQIRLLIIAKDGGPVALSHLGVASWQGDKFVKQAQAWSMEKLVEKYRQLIGLEHLLKSGQTPYTLAFLLDFWLVTP